LMLYVTYSVKWKFSSDNQCRTLLCYILATPFAGKFNEDKVSSANFQPNCVTAHTHRLLHDPFAGRMFSKNISTMHSRDLTLPDDFLWGTIKNIVYRDNPYTRQELEEAIMTSVWPTYLHL
jgi:hypothetical protein